MSANCAGELQVSKSVKPDNLEGFSGGIANIFGGFDEGIAGGLEDSQDGECEVGQGGEDLAEAGAAEIMTVFVPPTVFDEVQRVLDLPMVANNFLEIGRRDVRRIKTRDEVSRVVRKQRTIMADHIAIDAHNDLTIRDVQLFAKVIGVVDVAPEFANFGVSFFLLQFTSSGSPTSENAYFTASNASP